MKTIRMMLVAAALFSATTLMAQNPRGGMMQGTPAEKAQRMTSMMTQQLSLTADQQKQLTAIYTDYFTKEEALQKEREAAVNKVLTADQQKKMQEMRSNMQRPMGQAGQQRDGSGRQQR